MNNELVISQDLLLELIKSLYNTNDEKHIKSFIKHTIQSFSCKFINDFIKLYSLMEMEFKSKTHSSREQQLHVKANIENELDENTKVNIENKLDENAKVNIEAYKVLSNVYDKPLTNKRMQNIDDSTFHFDEFLHECYLSIINISGPDLYKLYCNYVDTHVNLFKDLTNMPSSKVFISAFRKYTGNAKQKWIKGSKKFLYSLKPDVYVKYAYETPLPKMV